MISELPSVKAHLGAKVLLHRQRPSRYHWKPVLPSLKKDKQMAQSSAVGRSISFALSTHHSEINGKH
jgi:hypothetical protein